MGGVHTGRTVWRVADNLDKILLCQFSFSWAKFKTRYVGFRVNNNP